MPLGGGIEYHDPNVHVGQVWWLALQPLRVRRGVQSVTITGVRLASHYPGVTLVGTARFSLKQTGNTLFNVATPSDLERERLSPSGPFVGATELPGDPADYGAVEVRFDRPGFFKIVDIVLSYRTPDGSGEQIIACDFRLTVSG